MPTEFTSVAGFHRFGKSTIVELHFYTGNELASVIHIFRRLKGILQSYWAHEFLRCGKEIGSIPDQTLSPPQPNTPAMMVILGFSFHPI